MSAATNKPAAVGATKPHNKTGVTDVPAVAQRKVTYIFNATSSKGLSIPYAVAVNGQSLAAYAKKPSRVSGTGGKVTLMVNQGDRVSLFLNSDAHPSYRSAPVYSVTAGERDIEVTITEKKGKHADSDTPVLKAAAPGATVDEYTAPLTGDIWMKVSHKYTSAEVDALLPAGTAAEVVTAIKSIYDGLKSATLAVSIAAKASQPAKSLTITFEDSSNPKANITKYTLLGDGLPRVQPGGYAALPNAALENNIKTLTVTSCWRPMLGSIAHRAGLGLDVGVVGVTTMNREELRIAFEGKKDKKPTLQGDGNDKDNVTDAEVTAFGEYEQAIVESKKAQAEAKAASTALDAAKKSGDPAKIKAATLHVQASKKAADEATETEEKKGRAWNNERDAGEPAHARLFRTSLLKCACVSQLFDPWFMDGNTRDSIAPEPNMQRGKTDSNERLHAHHLHITVHEPKIL